MQIQTTSMPNEIRNALPHSDWDKVYELISRNRKLKQQLNDKIDLSDFGHQIYGHHDAPIDPFFPGMHKLANLTTEQLAELRTTIIFTLKKLSKADSDWKRFYSDRLAAFSALTINTDHCTICDGAKTANGGVAVEQKRERSQSS